MNTFFAPTKLIWDCQAEEAIAEIFNREQWRKTGVIVDKKLLNIPIIETILCQLKAVSKQTTIFEQDVQEPDTDYADSVAAIFKANLPEVMVGIGGGSTLDVAKAVSVLLANKKDAASYQGFLLVEKPGISSVMLPTTAGTGSENTWTAVLTNRERKRKAGINSPYLFPKYAILDARLTVSMPKYVTVSTGMDALAHAIESFSAKSATIVSQLMSKQAFFLVYRGLSAVLDDEIDLSARQQALLGSSLAGRAITNAGTGACHSIAYALGTYYHVSHGVAITMLLSKVMRINDNKQPGLYALLWDVIHPEDAHLAARTRSQQLIAAMENLLDEAGFNKSLSEFGVSDQNLLFLAERSLDLKSALQNNPTPFALEDATTALHQIL